MERNFKVCLVIGGVLVFLAGLVVIGSGTLIYLNRDKLAEGFKNWSEDVEKQAREGERFGASTDENGCLGEALRQSEGKGQFGALAPTLFLSGCLRSAAPVEGFCDGVPAATEILATIAFGQTRCAGLDRTNDQACIQIMQSVQGHCSEANRDPSR